MSTGGLLELVARGKKDIFFTSNPQISFFHSVYPRCAAFTKEIFVAKPRNSPEWGKYVDFDIDHRGDVIKQLYLRIQLPSWLPASLKDTKGVFTDLSGVSYGFTNRVGFIMIDKIQYFNDNVLLFESFGTHMDWRARQEYEFGVTGILNDEIGGSMLTTGPGGMSRSLRVPIPMLGSQRLGDPGLPLSALRGNRFRIRVHLRPYTDVLVASDGRLKPNPFNMRLKIQTVKNGEFDTSHTSLPAACMKRLDITLESTYLYLPTDVNTWLKASVLRFPFRAVQQQLFTLEDNIMNAAATTGVATNFPLPLDFMGPVSRLMVGIRSEANTLSGMLTTLTAPGGVPFIRSMRLNIANIDRVKKWDIDVFREVSAFWKHTAPANDEIYTISFGGFESTVPCGTVSFTRAVLPTLYLVLGSTTYDPRTISRAAIVEVFADSWNLYEVGGGRGRLMFDDS